MIPILIFAVSFILLIVFDQAMSDLFPVQYKSFIDSQKQSWSRMEIISFPRIEKFLTILLYVTGVYAAVLLVLVSICAYIRLSQWIGIAESLCAIGGSALLGSYLLIRIYVMIKGNTKTSQNLDRRGWWGLLFLLFMGMTYWINTLT